MNAKLFQRLTIGEGVGTRHISFKRYTALVREQMFTH
jgi:hypothetical protein